MNPLSATWWRESFATKAQRHEEENFFGSGLPGYELQIRN